MDNNIVERVLKRIIKYRKNSGSNQSLNTLKAVANVNTVTVSLQNMLKEKDSLTRMNELCQKLHHALFKHALEKEALLVHQKDHCFDNLPNHLKHCSIYNHIHSFDYVSFFNNFLKEHNLTLSKKLIDAIEKAIKNLPKTLTNNEPISITKKEA